MSSTIIHQASYDGDEAPDKLNKIGFQQSDVLGEALCAVIAHDSVAR